MKQNDMDIGSDSPAQSQTQASISMTQTRDFSDHRITDPTSLAGLELRKRLLSMKEAAEYLGRSVNALRELQWAGRLPYVQEGKRIFFDVLDLDIWIQEHKKQEASLA